MKVLYFDCFSGISGDMTLGALLDVGLSVSQLQKEIDKLGINGLKITAQKTQKLGITGTNVVIEFPEDKQPHRNLNNISQLINKSTLKDKVKKNSIKIFELLAQAEGLIHGKPPEKVHFHEVGALDSLADIVGSAVALDLLNIDKIISSPLPFNRGYVKAAHGLLPLPAPATAEIYRMKNIPLVRPPQEIAMELVTPTGAAILGALAEEFGPPPPIEVKAIGYGTGKKDFPFPNMLRVFLAELSATDSGDTDTKREEVKNLLIETNIDDMNPEIYDHLLEKLFEAGALDVFLTPIQMKKNRPGIKLSVLTQIKKAEPLRKIIFKETSSIGLREIAVSKTMLKRKTEETQTPWGQVRVKVSYLEGEEVNRAPEYEDCRRIAKELGIPLKKVYEFVCRAEK